MKRPVITMLALVGATGIVGFAAGFVNPPEGATKTPAKSEPVSLTTQPVREGVSKKASEEKAGAKKSAEGEASAKTEKAEKGEKSEKAEKAESKPASNVETKTTAAAVTEGVTADEALKLLREGNQRWVDNQPKHPNTDTSRREETAAGQKPFVTVLTCSDSRLPVERVFDRGVGDVFVVRVAGNVVSSDSAGTIEYGAEHLHVPLLVVMGHTKCGAVAAAATHAKVGGNIATLVEKINPAVARTRQQNPNADDKQLAALSVKENVWQSVFDLLRTSSEVRHLVSEGKLKVVGAVCDVTTGQVEWFGEHPWQDALVQAFEAKDSLKAQTATVDDEKEDSHK